MLDESRAPESRSPTHTFTTLLSHTVCMDQSGQVVEQVGAKNATTRAPGGPPTFVFPGPMQHHQRPELFIRAACELLRSNADARVCIFGPDTLTGPLGQSCWKRVERYIPQALRSRVELQLDRCATVDDLTDAAIVFPGTLATRPDLLELALLNARSVLLAATHEHSNLVRNVCNSNVAPIRLFQQDNAAQLAKLMNEVNATWPLTPPAITNSRRPLGFADSANELQQLVSERSAVVQRPVISTAAPALHTPSRQRITVVIPFFNLAAYLPETLASVKAQTFTNYDLLIVNDGSTDPASMALLGKLEREGVRVLHKDNGGLGSARNFGLKRAATNWVLMLDADDLIDPTYLAKAMAVVGDRADRFQRHGLAAVGSLMRCFSGDPAIATGGWIPLGLDRDLLASTNIGCTASCLLNRDAALSVGGYDEYLVSFEDWDFWCRLAQRDYRVEIIPEYLFSYRQREDSMYHALARHNEAALRMYILAKHPQLCRDWSRAMRIEVAMRHHAESGAGGLSKPLRYVLADKVNAAAKKVGLGSVLKVIKKAR